MSLIILLASSLMQAATPAPPPVVVQAVPAPPVQVGSRGARATANLASLISQDDYPADAARAGQQGTTGFRLGIGPEGRVTDCIIEQSSGHASLDSATCRLMRSRARFTPARDAAGKPVSDSLTARISWRLPRPPYVPDLVVTRFTIGADGTPRDCSRFVDISGRTEERKAADCQPQPPSGPMLAALRQAGGAGDIPVRFETRLIRDASAPWPDLDQPGTRILGRNLMRLRIGPGGAVLGCVVLDRQTGGLPVGNPCPPGVRVSGYAEAQEAEMRLVTYVAIDRRDGTR